MLTIRAWLFTIYLKIASKLFALQIEDLKYYAYEYHIRRESAAAERLNLVDEFKWGSKQAKTEEEVRVAMKKGVSLEHTVPLIGKSTEERKFERLIARDDLLISNMVKKAAAGTGVEPV